MRASNTLRAIKACNMALDALPVWLTLQVANQTSTAMRVRISRAGLRWTSLRMQHLDSNTDIYVCAGLSQYCLCIYLHLSSEQTLLFGTNQVSGTQWWMPRKPCRELQLELSHGDDAETGWNRWPKTFLTWYATASLRLLRCLVLFRCGTCASRVWESAKENMVPKCQASVTKV